MAAESPFPQYDISKFKWKLSVGESKRAERLAAGGELIQDIWNREDKGDGMMFLGVYVTLHTPVQSTVLEAAAKNAWAWLRFYIPTLAARTESDADFNTKMVYDVASPSDVQAWVDRTLRITKQTAIDLDKLRYEVGVEVIPSEAGDQTFLHLVPGAKDMNGAISSLGLLLHSHHITVDGSAGKAIITRYLQRLTMILASDDVEQEDLPWGTEATNLLPSVYQIMHPSQALPIPTDSAEIPTVGHPYYSNLEQIMDGLANGFENSHSMKQCPSPVDDSNDWPQTRRLQLNFTKEESDLLLKKRKLEVPSSNKGYTVNQIVHAALTMAMVHDSPPPATTSAQCIHYVLIADGRHRLCEPYASRNAFPGYCLSLAPLNIPLSTFRTTNNELLPFDKNMLVATAKKVKELYEAQKQNPALLTAVAQQMDILVEQLKMFKAIGIVPPPSWSPWFSGDGPGEKLLDTTYHDSTGKLILEIDNFFISVNKTAPGPFCRVKSWKGIIDLGLDFNEKVMPRDRMEHFMAKWKEYVLLVAEFNEEDYV